uniref:Uncharacterized protein n=1 Tax=Coptotermes formosanus TaxID=36987 RepID=R4UN38_COPFO|nr:hypothetical protein [Coptotermes formosanus]
MDMVFNYLPDVFCYQSVRNHNYGNSWLNETTNEGNIASADHNRTKKTPRDSCKDPKVSCPICEERQRRPLATYIRTKSRQDRKEDQSIPEDDGENVEAAASDNGQKSEARVTPQQTPAAK